MPTKKSSKRPASRKRSAKVNDEIIWLIIFALKEIFGPLAQPYINRLRERLDAILGLSEGEPSSKNNSRSRPRRVDFEDRDESTWDEILEVSKRATDKEAKAAHRAKVKLCHPDKVSHLDKDFLALAHQKTKRLNQALEEALSRKK
jgi:hypothetical protein